MAVPARAFFGIAARRATLDYLTFTVFMVFILLAIAWTIDMAKTFGDIQAKAAREDQSVLSVLVPYLGYRATDIILRLLPVSCFFGVFLAEIFRRLRLDSVVLAAAGVTPMRLLAPLVIYGICVGSIAWLLEDRARPAAIEAQVKQGLGGYAGRFKKDIWLGGDRWFLFGDTALRGEVYRGQPPAMRDVQIFKGLQSEELEIVYHADAMTPGATPGLWELSGVTQWSIGSEIGTPVADLTLELALIREELEHHAIPGFYLPTPVLVAQNQSLPGSPVQVSAEVALWRRTLIWLMPFVVATLAMLLARLGFTGRLMRIPRLIGLGATGYILVVSLKVFFAIGEIGGLSGGLANGAPLMVIGAVAIALFYRETIRV